MVRTKVICEKCGREISKSNIAKHLRSHETYPENFEKEQYHLDHDDLFCKFCGKECKNKNSLVQHEIRCKENPNKINACISNFNNIGRIAWNKGLTKETDERVRQRGLNLHNNVKSGKTIFKGHSHSEETKEKLKGAIYFFNGERSNMQMQIRNGEKLDKAGGIYMTPEILKQFQELVGEENAQIVAI